ncbi:MAG: helix-turn-helix transcriptional regulator [Clostridiales bacterium]|nr:helix-turn-helix transcriptional regulator [Clostridiales bacterium]
MTLEELASEICKSKATVSKYEKGEIAVDIETLYEIADALHVHVEQLLYQRPERAALPVAEHHPSFFQGLTVFYAYLFDGRNNTIMRCRFDVLSQVEPNQYKIMMYMNFQDYEHYQICETTYYGYISHFDAVTNISLTNQDSPMEQASAEILASYLDADTKWGLWKGFSSRPMMPIATKMLFSRHRMEENAELAKTLKISREDIRLLKLYNMLSVV